VIALRPQRAALYLLAAVLVLIFMGPFLWSIGSSLKTAQESAMYPPKLFPAVPQFSNYATVLTNPKVPMLTFTVNTAWVAILSVVGQVVSATLVAYGFSRFRFPTGTCSSRCCSARWSCRARCSSSPTSCSSATSASSTR
jgi:multiple sugar transport system permease protein